MPIVRDEAKRKEIVDLLAQAYWMELETVQSDLANSINLDGVRARKIKNAINYYVKVIRTCGGGDDPVTADMATTILAVEEGHLRRFEGLLKEYEKR